MIAWSSPCLLKILIAALFSLLFVQYMYSSIETTQLDALFVINSSLANSESLFSYGTGQKSEFNSNASSQLVSSGKKNETSVCPVVPPNLIGIIEPLKDKMSLEEVVKKLEKLHILPGGQWRPSNCNARYRVALIVPYRNRVDNLALFLLNLHPLLQRQQLDYGIFIIEQAGHEPFNRGMLLNVGYVEALALRDFDCFIFHDVDLLPEDDRNLYTCPDQPRHMSVAIDIHNYRLPYADIFGGVCALSKDHFQKVNGFSNMFWGWGAEDDDMANRIKASGLHITRYPAATARYTMLRHTRQKANPKRYELLYSGKKRFRNDGLKNLQYRRIEVRFAKLFTWVLVELSHIKPR